MKYNILINQKAVIDCGFDLDIVDLAIFELLKDFSLSKDCKKLTVDGLVYFLFNWRLVNVQLPILGLNSRQSVYKRFEKLIACDIISPNPENKALCQSWYSFGPNYDKLIFKRSDNVGLHDANESSGSDNPGLLKSDNPGLHNNDHSNNIIKKSIGVPPATIRERKIKFCQKVLQWSATHHGKYPKTMYKKFVDYWMEDDNEVTEKTKRPTMRFEVERFFSIGRRLSTWFGRAKDTEIMEYWNQEEKIDPLNVIFRRIFNP